MHRARGLAVVAVVAAVIAFHGCNCGGPIGGTGGGSGGTGGGSGGGSGGGGSGGSADAGACSPACVSPDFCGATLVCLAPGACRLNQDCSAGKICDPATKLCVPGSSCGSTEVTGGVAEPNLFISLDRSCSMRTLVGTQTKWEIAVAAIKAMTLTYAGKIRFGLALFPDRVTPDCAQGQIPIPVDGGTEPRIRSLLDRALDAGDPNFPDGPCVTNIDTGMRQASTDPALGESGRSSYVLLITDGKQAGCNLAGGDNGTTGLIHDLRTTRAVKTFVVGFGAGVDPAQMNLFADAGGVPSSTPGVGYYRADDQASLAAALATIGSRTLGCTYNLTQVPPDPASIFVFFDNSRQIARDLTHADGWDYELTTHQVTFYGPACASLKAGQVSDLDIVFGCPSPGIN